MEIETLAVCGLCLQISSISKYGVPSETLMMLRALNIEKLNLSLKEDSVVCSICENKLKNVFNLKAKCLKQEKSRMSSKVNKILDKSHSEILDECRLCNNIISPDCGVILLDVLKENNIIEPFQKYLMKMDLDAIKKSIICELCHTSLWDFHNFLLSCTIGKDKKSKETSQLLNSEDHSQQESDILYETDTQPVDSSLFCTNFDRNDTVEVKIEINDNDIHNECKITDAQRKEFINNEDHCCASKITTELGNTTVSHDIESIKGKITEEINKECNNASDVNDVTNMDMQEKVASDALELQLKNEEIDIKSGPEEFMSEIIGATETSEDHMLSVRKSNALKVQKCQQAKYKVIVKRPVDAHEISHQIEKHKYQSKNRPNLTQHMLIHKKTDEVEMHKCQKCTFQSKQKLHLKRHKLTHKKVDEIEMHKCQECTFQSKYKHYLKQHMLTHKNLDDVEIYKCHKCTFQSKQKLHLKRHKLTHKNVDEVKMYKCQKCTFQSKHKHCLKLHMLTYKNTDDGSEMNNCQKCTYQTKNEHVLKRHMLTHKHADETKMHRCQKCTFQSKYKYNIGRHMLTHKSADQIEMLNCSKCTSQFKRKSYLKKHMLIHENTDEIEMHNCQICTYMSNQKSYLERHMLIHKTSDEVQMYKCQKCPYQTKNKYVLKRHMLIHKNAYEVEMHKCQKCTFQSKHKHYITVHMLTHKSADQIEMLKCLKCTSQFKRKSYLKSHLLTHKKTDEIEMYKCQKCTYQFKNKNYLAKHMLTHKNVDEVKMYKCHTCTFQSKYKNSLVKHVLIHETQIK